MDAYAEDEAAGAAQAKAKDLKREGITASCTVFGDPTIRAGAGMSFAGIREGVDGIPFIIQSVTHDYSKSGYTTALTMKLEGAGKTKRKPGAPRVPKPDADEEAEFASAHPRYTPLTHSPEV
ncbi:hypothetical protein [Devosia sp. 919]|uniref:hypothetical protein n=1 Tax=Devosia sp. 919 TaxID=2726065 RepID=UPI0015536589|nr:hypothetical protein [Devosia sp. 919]